MKPIVLVLTNTDDDAHVEPVLARLALLGKRYFRLDVDKISSGELALEFTFDKELFFTASVGRERVSSVEIGAVWYRRPNYFKFPISDQAQKEFAEKETAALLGGLYLSLNEVHWLNQPGVIEIAGKKIFQLRKAVNLGFKIPKTVVSNVPDLIEAFFEKCNGKIVFKTMSQGFLDYGDTGFTIPTTLLAEAHLEHLHLITRCPSLFQEFIDKAYDVRVTVVGDKLFATKIDSQEYRETAVDWRHPSLVEKLKYQSVTLPPSIGQKCLELTHDFGLRFGAIDLAVDKNGEYYFFEINPNGQWQWVEYFTGAPISSAIAEELSLMVS